MSRAVRTETVAPATAQPGTPLGTQPGAACAVRLVARDWPGASWVAVPCLGAGAPLLVWAAATGHAVEAGGALVFCAFGALAAWLSLAKRRDVVVARTADAVTVRGREGAGPFARAVDLALPADVRVEVVPFAVPRGAVPDGASDLPDRGGDVVLEGGGTRVRLARRTGPGWRAELESAALALRDGLGKKDGVPGIP